MADFEMQLAPFGWVTVRGPKWVISEVFQAYFEPPPNFIILKEIFKRQPHALARIIRGRYFGPYPPCNLADFEMQVAPLEGVAFRGPKRGNPQGVSGLF